MNIIHIKYNLSNNLLLENLLASFLHWFLDKRPKLKSEASEIVDDLTNEHRPSSQGRSHPASRSSRVDMRRKMAIIPSGAIHVCMCMWADLITICSRLSSLVHSLAFLEGGHLLHLHPIKVIIGHSLNHSTRVCVWLSGAVNPTTNTTIPNSCSWFFTIVF